MKSPRKAETLSDDALRDPQLRPYGPMVAMPLLVPCAPALDGDQLEWRTGEDNDLLLTPRHPEPAMLEQFLSLAAPRATAAAILRFATEWGPLSPEALGDIADTLNQGNFWPTSTLPAFNSGWPQGRWREPLATWRQHAQRMRAMVRVAAALHDMGQPDQADWIALFPGFAEVEFAWARMPDSVTVRGLRGRPVVMQRAWDWRRLRHALDQLLGAAAVRPTLLLMTSEDPIEAFVGKGLLGALAVSLMHTLCRRQGPVTCAGCGGAFEPHRRPIVGRRSYCQACRKGKVPQLDAARDTLRRREQARALHAEGKTAAEIARVLDRPTKRIRRWISAQGRPRRTQETRPRTD